MPSALVKIKLGHSNRTTINCTIPQLRALLAIAESKSFRLAAERLNLSQPAISARISQMELHLDIPLLHRTTRLVVLTPAGEQLANAAKRALSELEMVAAQLQSQAMLQSGKVTVASIPTIAESLLAPLIAGFGRSRPGITINLIDLNEARCVDSVMTGEADFGIFTYPKPNREVTWQALFREEIVVLVPSNHPLAGRRTASLGTLSRFEIIGPPDGSALRNTIDAMYIRANQSFAPNREAFNFHTLLGYVLAGLGIAFVPTIFATRLDQTLCQTISVHPKPVFREIGLLTLRGRILSPAASAFASYVDEHLMPVYSKRTVFTGRMKTTVTNNLLK